jgi:small membrane protein
MTVFQIIAVVVLGALALLTLANMVRSRRAVGALWLVVWAGAAAAIIEPRLTTWVAHFLGIERGADLVFYCAVLGGLLGFFFVYLRLRGLSRQLTLLTRNVAIANAKRPEEQDASGGDAADGR